MKIFTGHTGTPHVTADIFRTLLIGIFGKETFIFPIWDMFDHELESNNSILIKRGVMIHHGNISYTSEKTGDRLTITNGTQGMKRIDLIVNRYKRDEMSGTESNELVYIQGTPDAATAKEPEYSKGNVLDGALIDDCPLYKVEINGLNVSNITKLVKVRNGCQTPITAGVSAPSGGEDGDVYIQFES